MYRKWLSLTAGILLAIMIITGCSNKNSGTATPPGTTAPATASAETTAPGTEASASPSPSADMQKPIMDAFEALLKTSGNEKAAIAQMKQDVSKLSPENADQMILSLEAYQAEALKNPTIISDALIKLISGSEEPYYEKTLNDLSKITDAELKAALQAVFERGYKIIVPEGMYEAVIDYGVYKDAAGYASPDIAAYIGIMASESEQRTSEDAAIIIPVDEVFARALAAERFIVTYSNSVKYDQIEQKYMNYVDTLFFGQNNTPAFDYMTKKLGQEFLDSYEKAAAGGGDSVIVTAISEYLEILNENDYTLTNAVTDYRDLMTRELKGMIS
jgi:hypothetical protein